MVAVPLRSSVVVVGTLVSLSCAGKSTPDPVSAEPEPVAIRVPEPSPTPVVEEPEPEPKIELEGYDEVADVLGAKWISWMGASTRMAMARRGGVRLRADGPEYGLADGKAFPTAHPMMVVDDGERPRVVVNQGGVRLLVHVDRADAQPLLSTRARLRPDPAFRFADPPKRGHVIVERGTWVDVIGADGEASEVRWTGPEQSWSGWIDTSALGTTIGPATPEPSATTAPPATDPLPPYRTKKATALRVRPGGKVLIELGEDDEVQLLTDKPNRGYHLVEFQPGCDIEVSYVGYVRARDVFQPEYGIGYGCGRGWPRMRLSWGDVGRAPRVKIAAGTFLLAPDQPTVVGCVMKETTMAAIGGEALALPTVWGPVHVRLAPGGFEGPCGTVK
ncbi:MAG: hypothetical protein AAF799_24875 [Myxococcota bacterium]